jgi:hypothetical protein
VIPTRLLLVVGLLVDERCGQVLVQEPCGAINNFTVGWNFSDKFRVTISTSMKVWAMHAKTRIELVTRTYKANTASEYIE